MESVILSFIKQNPDDWEQELNRRLIRTLHDGDRVCFKYGIMADFSDPLVCEARGIIIDLASHKVVCRPFDKFFNVQEQYAASIDWKSARVLEKVDGSLIKLYWYKDSWVFATNSTCDARNAPVSGNTLITFYDVIKSADNYGRIPFEALDKEYTYIFELVSPLTQVVIRYERPVLYFLSARNNETGEENDAGFGTFLKPRSFPLGSLKECLDAVLALNGGDEEDVTDEGFVVVDAKHDRIKIKSPAYITMHKMKTGKLFTPKQMIELFLQDADLAKLAGEFEDEAHIIKYYDWQLEEVRYKIREMTDYARALYKEYDHDRRAVALTIKDSPYAFAGFAALDSEKSSDEIMKSLSVSRLERLIKEYNDMA